MEIAGPDLQLSASATEAIGMALHELATNSAKYGALSVPNGRLKVVWSLEPTVSAPAYVLLGVETEGPVVQAPEQKGFGSVVIERIVASAVDGKVHLEFSPTGVYWRLEFPCEHLVELDRVDEQNKGDHGIKPGPADDALAG